MPFATTPQGLARRPADDVGRLTSYVAELARDAAAAPGETARPGGPAGDDLRPAIAVVLGRLASRTGPALVDCLRRSREKWDQADSLSILDADLTDEIAALRLRLTQAAQPVSPAARRAVALEGLLALDASRALVGLFERRLAPLLRLRLRSTTPDVLPEGRPFLDLGEALHEVAEAWR